MKKFCWLFLLLCAFGTMLAEDYLVVHENGKSYLIYPVQKSEGIYAVSRRFGISQADIIAANPGSENGLKLGETLRIPTDLITAAEFAHLATTADEPETPAPSQQQPSASTADNTVKKAFGQLPGGADPGYTTHTVKAKETLYSLAKKYGTTVDGLLELNPWATQLQAGSVLIVPDPDYAKEQEKARKQAEKEAKKQAEQEAKIASKRAKLKPVDTPADAHRTDNHLWVVPTDTSATESDTLATDTLSLHRHGFYDPDSELAVQKPQRHLSIAVLMPFSLDATERDAGMDRFVEFYKGCLLAADSLTNEGLDFDFYAYDIGKTTHKLSEVLLSDPIKQVDLIIGPAYQSQIPLVAKFAATYKIPVVVPFASNTAETLNNKYLFQIVSPQKELYGVMAESYAQTFADFETVIIDPKKVSQTDKFGFTDTLQLFLDEAKLPYHRITDANIALEADSLARLTEKKLLLVLPSTQPAALTNLGEQLKLLTEPDIEVFGFAEWHNTQLKDLYERPLYAYTNYYTDFNDPQVHRFFAKFINRYGMPGIQNIPNYALFGYDITLFFSEMIANYGPDFRFFLPELPVALSQMDFYFEKISQEGGYLNRGVLLQRFDTDGINRYAR
ncbi:MAG: LysM peptidoglycan-binding domain-containing protein [Paludibacteraceae bacterium]|nr:LysM peptidoglycan-binding domain-containing protein [Paludibacteraceae bacterium]